MQGKERVGEGQRGEKNKKEGDRDKKEIERAGERDLKEEGQSCDGEREEKREILRERQRESERERERERGKRVENKNM